jgi:histidinol-phosphate/aromatic aminotransferase/cobyric acid decarboxylase-like protein
MSITRRNLLHGIAAAGTVIAAGARSVKALAPNGLKQPLPGAPASGPTVLDRNENAYGPSDKVQAVIREAAAASSRYPRGEYDALRKMLAERETGANCLGLRLFRDSANVSRRLSCTK